MNIRTYHSLFALKLAAALLLAACALPPTRSAPREDQRVPPALDPVAVARGAQIYAAYCASCHGADLRGEADWKEQNPDGSFRSPPHDASGHTWHHADAVLLEAIREGGARFAAEDIGGTSAMPAFGEQLSEAEMTAVLSFIKSSWPDDIRAIQWQQTLQDQGALSGN